MSDDYRDLAALDMLEESMGNAFKNVAAQIMRYARGSGDSTRLLRAVVEAAKYADVPRRAPALADRAFNQLREWRSTDGVAESLRGDEYATIQICEGALQLVASRLGGDPGIEPRGKQQLAEGAKRLEEAQREFNAKLQSSRSKA